MPKRGKYKQYLYDKNFKIPDRTERHHKAKKDLRMKKQLKKLLIQTIIFILMVLQVMKLLIHLKLQIIQKC